MAVLEGRSLTAQPRDRSVKNFIAGLALEQSCVLWSDDTDCGGDLTPERGQAGLNVTNRCSYSALVALVPKTRTNFKAENFSP